MKDYSKYFKGPESFILSYRVENDKILVKFAGLKKEQEYPLTKENIIMFDKRMEAQYNEVIKERTLVNGSKKIDKIINSVMANIAIGGISGLFYVEGIATSITLPIIAIFMTLVVIGVIIFLIEAIKNLKIHYTLGIYNEYINNRNEISKAAKKEQNITKHLSNNKHLNKQQELVKKELIETEFNINLMDNMSIKDLKELSTQLKIYKGLQHPVEFIGTEHKKTRTRKK